MISLQKEQYSKLLEPIKSITNNNLFARAVAERVVEGEIFVDNVENPKSFYLLHPYGMSLLFGHSKNKVFNLAFKKYVLNENRSRKIIEWMQVFPADWDAVLQDLLRDNLVSPSSESTSSHDIEQNVRVNFKFNKEKFLRGKLANKKSDPAVEILRTDREAFEKMTGTVVPLNFWNDAEDFINKGVAFSLYYDGKLASTAFSAYLHDDKLELGIETYDEFKGKGLAYKACTALIEYCIENGFEPVWACKRDNVGSYQLAQKLGFENVKEISYYRLALS
ncbi:GNAT family N-acetyltransferase [Dysgonomonas sp. HDW5B]|uniref:GNAT family N-acetyltransferase n=1 Tax=Dysgonomonas sp. HDW5B TaxID=2714927 RepID=UPI00140E861A|nr:GNAT family N-acetyltransferase [Dysgonomonas sp. HDW5B]QIK55227.1 GNAT family N-acetyltransferase [Dysgonomonas sp. HDW5B]